MHSISELQKNILLYMSTQLSLLSLSDDSESDVPEAISASVSNASIAFKYKRLVFLCFIASLAVI